MAVETHEFLRIAHPRVQDLPATDSFTRKRPSSVIGEKCGLEARKVERKLYRQMLGWVLLIGGSAWLLWRSFPAGALAGFVVLPFQWAGALSGVERMDRIPSRGLLVIGGAGFRFSEGALAPHCLWSFPGFGPNLLSFQQPQPLLLLVLLLLVLIYLIVRVFHRNLIVDSEGVSPWKTPRNHSGLWKVLKTRL